MATSNLLTVLPSPGGRTAPVQGDTAVTAPEPAPQRARKSRAAFFTGSVAFGIELGRLERALSLSAQPIGRRRFLVTGGAERHYVDLDAPSAAQCDCDDRVQVGPCKHILRARLHEGDESVLGAVATLVQAFSTYAKDLEQRLRPRTIRLTKSLVAHVARTVGHPVTALTFDRIRTGTDAGVIVHLGRTGIVLGRLVRDDTGIAFLPDQPGGAATLSAA
jgi:hypothetical protein